MEFKNNEEFLVFAEELHELMEYPRFTVHERLEYILQEDAIKNLCAVSTSDSQYAIKSAYFSGMVEAFKMINKKRKLILNQAKKIREERNNAP